MGEVKPQFLYIVGASRNGPVKIGIAAKPHSRRSELQTGHPHPLEVFWIYPCPHGATVEPLIHRILAKKRCAGEWFDVPVEVAMAALWIASNGDANPTTDDDLQQWAGHIGLCLNCCSALDRDHVFGGDESVTSIAADAKGAADATEAWAIERGVMTFDRTAYQREYMRRRREKEKLGG